MNIFVKLALRYLENHPEQAVELIASAVAAGIAALRKTAHETTQQLPPGVSVVPAPRG